MQRKIQNLTPEARRRQEEAKRRQGYGNSSSYTPATDTCSAPFVPPADVYSPPPADPSPSYDSGGGSFDGGGASGDY